MPDPTPTEPTQPRPRRDWAPVVYWLVAGAIYAALGVAYPPAFLLGFQEAAIYVLIVTALQPHIVRRRR